MTRLYRNRELWCHEAVELWPRACHILYHTCWPGHTAASVGKNAKFHALRQQCAAQGCSGRECVLKEDRPGSPSAESSPLVLVSKDLALPAPSSPSLLSSFWLSMPPSDSVLLEASHPSKSTASCVSQQRLGDALPWEPLKSVAAATLHHAQWLSPLLQPRLKL